MKKQRLLALALATLLAAFVCLGACDNTASGPSSGAPASNGASPGTGQAEKTTIVLWHTYTDQHEEALQKIADGFNASQDKYTLKLEQQPYSEIDAKMMQAVRNNTGPDFSTLFPSLAIQYISEGLLVDFSKYLDDPEIGMPNFKDNIMPGLYSEVTQWGGGQVYMIPTTTTGEVLFYNKTLFDELNIAPPKTWSDVEAYSKLIYAEKGIPGFGTDSTIDTYQCLIKQAGSGYIDAASKTMDVDKDIAIDKLNWFADGVKAGYFRLVGEDMYFSNPFGSGAVASYIGSSAGVSYVYLGVGDAFEIGCVPIPQEGPVKYISSWAFGYVCFDKKDDTRSKGVYEFLKYFSSPDVTMDWAEGFGSVPVFLDVLSSERFKAFAQTNVAVGALAEALPYVGSLSSILGANGVRTRLDEMVQSVALGLADAETAYNTFITEANKELNP